MRKVTKNNGTLSIKEIPYDDAREMIVANHYSHKWNVYFGKLNIGIFQDDNPQCLGVAVFGGLMNPKSSTTIAEGLEPDNILELNRLWLDDVLVANAETTFLAMCFRYIKRNHPNIELIQSFADGRLGCGTIYKAANFRYYGSFQTLFFEDVNDENVTHHKTPFEDTRRLSTMAISNYRLANGELRAFRTKTFRYIYPLNKDILKRVKLKEQPYPPYSIGKDYDDNYVQTLAVMARSYMAFYIAGEDYKDQASTIVSYISENYGEHSVDQLRELARSKTMDKFYEDIPKTKVYLVKSLGKALSDNGEMSVSA